MFHENVRAFGWLWLWLWFLWLTFILKISRRLHLYGCIKTFMQVEYNLLIIVLIFCFSFCYFSSSLNLWKFVSYIKVSRKIVSLPQNEMPEFLHKWMVMRQMTISIKPSTFWSFNTVNGKDGIIAIMIIAISWLVIITFYNSFCLWSS